VQAMRLIPKHIALFGNFGSGNLGNEASLKAMLDLIRRRRPDVFVTCICYGVETAQAEHDVTTIPIKLAFPKNWWLAKVNRLFFRIPLLLVDLVRTLYLARSFDIFIVPGTGILDDFGERWQAMPYDLFRWSLAAKIWGRPFALVSIGAGPIVHPISRWLLISAARMACYRSYRDIDSKEYMQAAVGVPTQDDPVFPDLAFNLPVPECPSSELPNSRPTIGVGIMNYYGWDRDSARRPLIHETYIAQFTQFVCWLINHGYRVRLLMGAASDQPAVDEILNRIVVRCGQRCSPDLIAERAHSLQQLMCQMLETELIVATRFHNIVAALRVGRPAISIGYAKKNDALLAQVGLGAFCQPIEELDLSRLIADFQSLGDARGPFSDQVRRAVEQLRGHLQDQDAYILDKLL
jgi:polysaccharide pyruvyl transferase WcaK-like protein